jgi:hypothetical protein
MGLEEDRFGRLSIRQTPREIVRRANVELRLLGTFCVTRLTWRIFPFHPPNRPALLFRPYHTPIINV